MLVSIDGKWKFPVEYELTNSFTGDDLVPVVFEILKATVKAGIRIRGVVFDWLSSNLSFAAAADAPLDIEKELVTYFIYPSNDEIKVYIIPDTVHM